MRLILIALLFFYMILYPYFGYIIYKSENRRKRKHYPKYTEIYHCNL